MVYSPVSREPHKPLSRLISFRISEADYQTLLESRQEMKAGSVSEVAREMVCAFLRTGGDIRKLGLAGSLRRIEGDMTELRGELRRFQRE
jgi:IS1 family transposase